MNIYMSSKGGVDKRQRELSLEDTIKNNYDLDMEFNSVTGEIYILAKECFIISGYTNVSISRKKQLLRGIQSRYKQLVEKQNLLKNLQITKPIRLSEYAYIDGGKAIKLYGRGSAEIDMQIYKHVQGSKTMLSPPRSSS